MIIDGNALVHRSYHALPPLTTKNGEVVNAVYGFTAFLLKAVKDFKPDFVALTFDLKEKTFRHHKFADYKGTRVKAPDELYAQIPRVKEVGQVLGMPIFEKAGFEADDLIGTLVKKTDNSLEKIIVTGDMDTLQLINKQTKVYTMKRGLTDAVVYDAQAVKERYGITPEQMIGYKALCGDPSDNIPGVKGIGEKTASELLREFGTLEKLYAYVKGTKSQKRKTKIKERILTLLAEHEQEALMSKYLATIKCDVKIDFNLDELVFGNFNLEKATQLFSELEFKSLLPRLQDIKAKNQASRIKRQDGKAKPTDGDEDSSDKFARNKELFNYQLVASDEEFGKFLIELEKQKEFAFDTETANFDPVAAELLGVSFCWKKGTAYYLNFQSKDHKIQKTANLFNYQSQGSSVSVKTDWLERMKPLFENDRVKKYGHNIKFDLEVMSGYGIKVKGVAGDSMIASYLLNPGTRQHNLDALAFAEFNHQKITKDDLLGTGRNKIGFGQVSLYKLSNYSCEDADFTFRLIKKLLPELEKQKLYNLFRRVEMPLVDVLVGMEENGIKIDSKFLAELQIATEKKLKKLDKEICRLSGGPFNINSTQQLREVLFEKLGLPIDGITKTKTGLSTGSDELAKLKDKHEIIGMIQEYRELAKLQSNYIEALPRLANKKTGRLHTSFNQSVTATGRLSSTDPNLQNIPIRTELGREIRKAFVAQKGYCLLSLDYSQIELRVAAHMSGDERMIRAFLDGVDIHRMTAAEINQISLEEVTPELRSQAKAVNFGILYGQGPHGLSQGADMPYWRAKEFIDNYFLVYHGVKKFIDKTIENAREKGYAETLFGRKRFLPEINSTMLQVRKGAERMAINTPIQGTAADMIKIAMIEINKLINTKYTKQEAKMLLQVHDELLFEIKPKLSGRIFSDVKQIMEAITKLKVPVEVDAKIGNNWGEMDKIKNN